MFDDRVDRVDCEGTTDLKDCEGWAAGFRMQDKGRALPSFSASSIVPVGSMVIRETIVLLSSGS